MMPGDEYPQPESARGLFGAELRRLRAERNVSQHQLADLVAHSRTLIATVEVGERWPSYDLAARCDDVLASGGTLARLWPVVETERRACREVVDDARLLDLRTAVLRLAVLTGTDLSVLAVTDEHHDAPTAGPAAAGTVQSMPPAVSEGL
jgi:predicted transcriptional regulator